MFCVSNIPSLFSSVCVTEISTLSDPKQILLIVFFFHKTSSLPTCIHCGILNITKLTARFKLFKEVETRDDYVDA